MTVEASEIHDDPRPRCPYVPGLRCGSKLEPVQNERRGKYTCRDPICASVYRFPVVRDQDPCGTSGAARRRKAARPASAGGIVATVGAEQEVRP